MHGDKCPVEGSSEGCCENERRNDGDEVALDWTASVPADKLD